MPRSKNSPKAERAAFSLARLGHDAVPVLKKYVGHKDTAVRSAVLFALTRTATKADQDVLKAMAEQIEKDRTPRQAGSGSRRGSSHPRRHHLEPLVAADPSPCFLHIEKG
jgi:HEAT repeat protein